MSASIKLIYYDGPALGEPIRFILSYGKMKFIDERITKDNMPTLKPTLPYGQVPVLVIEGKTIHQTKAICRYLAKKVGLVGKTDWDSLQCDIMVDTIDDFRGALGSFFYEKDPVAKEQKKELAMFTSVPFYLTKLEEHLAKNNGHFVNGQVTWADIYYASMTEYLSFAAGSMIFADKPNLTTLREKIIALPGIKEYMEQRPPLRAP